MSRRALVACALMSALASVGSDGRRSEDLSRVPLDELELGPNGIQRKKRGAAPGSKADPIRRHRKQNR